MKRSLTGDRYQDCVQCVGVRTKIAPETRIFDSRRRARCLPECLLVQRSGSTDWDHRAVESLTEKPYFPDDESTNPFTFVFTYEAKAKRTKLPGALICIQRSPINECMSLRMAEACPVAIFSWRLLDFEFNLPTND